MLLINDSFTTTYQIFQRSQRNFQASLRFHPLHDAQTSKEEEKKEENDKLKTCFEVKIKQTAV